MKIYDMFESISNRINKTLEIICGILLIIIVLIIWEQVFFRYFLYQGLPWAEIITKQLMIYMALLGAAVVFYEKSHVSINFFKNKIKYEKIVLGLDFLTLILAFSLFILLIYAGFDYANLGWISANPVTRIPNFWAYLAIPIGGLFLAFQSITLFLRLLKGKTYASVPEQLTDKTFIDKSKVKDVIQSTGKE